MEDATLAFSEIFESLNYYDDSCRVVIQQQGHRSHIECLNVFWWNRKVTLKKRREDQATIEHFIEAVRSCKLHHPGIEDKLSKLARKGGYLSVKKVRNVYRALVANQLQGIRRVACESKANERLIFDTTKKTYHVSQAWFSSLRVDKRVENRQAIRKYYQELIGEWGKPRVDWALRRQRISFRQMIKKGSPLLVRHVNALTISLSDYREQDLQTCFERIQKICRGEEDFSTLPTREKRGFAEIFGDEDAEQALKEHYTPHLETPLRQLPSFLYAHIQNVVHCDSDELELAFHGKRIEGVITGDYTTKASILFHDRYHEDKERLQLYHKISRIPHIASPDRLQECYYEIVSKAVVKKEMDEGMMIPLGGTLKRFYRVDTRILTGYAKVAYHVVQSNDDDPKIADMLFYRSSATAPSAIDSFTSWVTDANPFASPGYTWNRIGDDIEKRILCSRTDREIIMMGHSLGGGQAQLNIAKRIKRKELPNRKIHVIGFDSIGVNFKDSDFFAEWLKKPENATAARNLSFQYYFSDGDNFPGGGDAHLGFEADKSKLGGFSAKLLKAINPEVDALTPHPHGRLYYSSNLGKDFVEEGLSIEEYDTEPWRLNMETFRQTVGIFVAPIALLLGMTSRFLVGWRGGKTGVIQKLFRAVFN